MSNLIKKLLKEELSSITKMKHVSDVNIDDETKNKLKNISWRDIKISEGGDDGNTLVYLNINLPYGDFSQGIAVNIQLIKDTVYHIHLSLAKELQGLGLGYKIHKALIFDLGHLYVGKGRVLNKFIFDIWKKLDNDSDVECINGKNGHMCMVKNNPDKNKLLGTINI